MAKPAPSALADGDTGSYDSAEKAAIAGLRSIKETKTEFGGGVLFNPTTKKYAYTQPVGQGDGSHFGARIAVPQGWQLDSIYHTHPQGPSSSVFSADDVDMATQLKRPSYILPLSDNTIRKFDPTDPATKVNRNSFDPTRTFAPGTPVQEGPIPDGIPKAHPGTVLMPVQQPAQQTQAQTVNVQGSMGPSAPAALTDDQKTQLADLYDEAQRTGDSASMGRIRDALLADRNAAQQQEQSNSFTGRFHAAEEAIDRAAPAFGAAAGVGHDVVSGVAGLAAKAAGRVRDVLPGGADWNPGQPRAADTYPAAVTGAIPDVGPVGQAVSNNQAQKAQTFGRAVNQIPGVDTPAGQTLKEAIPEAAADVGLVGGASQVAGKVANGIATAAEIRATRPAWAKAGFTSEQAAAGHELGLRNGLDNPVAGYLSGSVKREILTNNNADVGNTIARYAARVPEEAAPGVTTPLTYEALDKALQPMEDVYRRAAAGLGQNGDAVLQKLRELRHDGFKAINSDDPAVIGKGRDLLKQADQLENVIEKNISPISGTSIEQFRAARQAIAQNRAVYEAMQGEDINMAALGRMYRNAPNKFADGPLKTLAQFAENNGAVVGRRIKGSDTTLRQGVEGAAGALDVTKPGSWPQVARVTTLPQRAVRGPGVQQTLRTLTPRDPNEFAPQPMRGLSPPPGQVGVLPQQGALPFGQAAPAQ